MFCLLTVYVFYFICLCLAWQQDASGLLPKCSVNQGVTEHLGNKLPTSCCQSRHIQNICEIWRCYRKHGKMWCIFCYKSSFVLETNNSWGTPDLQTPLDPLNCVLGMPQSTFWATEVEPARLKTYLGVAPAHILQGPATFEDQVTLNWQSIYCYNNLDKQI